MVSTEIIEIEYEKCCKIYKLSNTKFLKTGEELILRFCR